MVALKAQAIRAYLFVRQIAIDAATTEKLRHSARTFERRLRFLPFCDILFVPNNSIKKPHGDSIGIAVSSLFPCGKELLGDN